jgi:hypothetical protein
MSELQQDSFCISAGGNSGTESKSGALNLAVLLLHYYVLACN